jgi:hypothetical protein
MGKIDINSVNFPMLFNTAINHVRRYNKLVNKPSSPLDNQSQIDSDHIRDFNVWSGFKAKLIPKDQIETKRFAKLSNHLKVVWANNDEKIYNYILSWFNHIFKKPHLKTKIALVFRSEEQQIGKSIIVEEFLNKYVFGKRLSTVESGLGFATERFNEHILGKIFISCEELSTLSGDYHRTFDILKKIITNGTIKIEIKLMRELGVTVFHQTLFYKI